MLPAIITASVVYLLFVRTSSSNETIFAIICTMLLVFAIPVYFFITFKITNPLDILNKFALEIGIKNISHRVEMGKKVNCSKIKKCGRRDCPAYGQKTICWVVAGSQKKEPECPRAMKGEDCQTCELYNVNDEFGAIGSSLNVMANSFQKLLSEIAGATEKVNLSSMEISSTVEEQSFIASTEVSSIAEISATVEELTASSKQIAHSSRKVAQAAGDSLSKTDQGAVSIGHLVGEINVTLLDIEENRNRIIELKNKSEEIGDIMKIINSVVDQTKLISFNASIEASMAGETGKRFRVVAEKIRSLADSVMESTEKIENRIGEIQDSVQSLVISSDSSTEKMKKVASSSKVAEELLREIYQEARTNVKLGRQILTATQQQETASNQVAAAIREIMVGVEENSTALNQTAKITRDMVKLSKNLEGIMISE